MSQLIEVLPTQAQTELHRLSTELNNERLLRQELAASYCALQKLERSKDAFISLLNHELRTPLTIAIAAMEMLEGSSDPRKTRQVLEMLRASLARENDVIEDLWLFSRMVPGELRLERRAVRLEEMLRALAENHRSIWEEKKISLELVFEDGLDPFWGDSALLQTAFKHLLLNALRFNTNGGRVRIEAKNGPDSLEVEFSNTGMAVAPEEQIRIFDRFFQVAERLTRRVGDLGLGLGLAVVHRIVEAHGGALTVGSRNGGGSRLQVSLPRR